MIRPPSPRSSSPRRLDADTSRHPQVGVYRPIPIFDGGSLIRRRIDPALLTRMEILPKSSRTRDMSASTLSSEETSTRKHAPRQRGNPFTDVVVQCMIGNRDAAPARQVSWRLQSRYPPAAGDDCDGPGQVKSAERSLLSTNDFSGGNDEFLKKYHRY